MLPVMPSRIFLFLKWLFVMVLTRNGQPIRNREQRSSSIIPVSVSRFAEFFLWYRYLTQFLPVRVFFIRELVLFMSLVFKEVSKREKKFFEISPQLV